MNLKRELLPVDRMFRRVMEVELLQRVVLAVEFQSAAIADINLDRVTVVDDHSAVSRQPVRLRCADRGAHRAGKVDGRLLRAGRARAVFGGQFAPMRRAALAAIGPVCRMGRSFGFFGGFWWIDKRSRQRRHR